MAATVISFCHSVKSEALIEYLIHAGLVEQNSERLEQSSQSNAIVFFLSFFKSHAYINRKVEREPFFQILSHLKETECLIMSHYQKYFSLFPTNKGNIL